LGANNQYKEITQFTVEQKRYANCTSSNFRSSFGVDLCLSFNRPRLGGSLFELLKPVDLDRVLAGEYSDDYSNENEAEEKNHDGHDHEDDDDDDEELYGNLDRPKVTLSGPYHYQVRFFFKS
jgi:hypothetical protein